MSILEYREIHQEHKRLEGVVILMKRNLTDEIDKLKMEIVDAESELEDNRKKVVAAGREFKSPFMIRVDNDMVFRLEKNQPIQIMPITEETDVFSN